MEIKQVDYTQNSQQLLKKLDDYTKVKVPDLTGYESQKISFSIEEAGEVLGGIVGEIHWNYLRIELFYVAENTRGKGVGKQLLEHVEQLAKEANCQLIVLETMSFNAPGFYLKNGYQEIGKIEEHPLPAEAHYFMMKRIAIS